MVLRLRLGFRPVLPICLGGRSTRTPGAERNAPRWDANRRRASHRRVKPAKNIRSRRSPTGRPGQADRELRDRPSVFPTVTYDYGRHCRVEGASRRCAIFALDSASPAVCLTLC